MCTIAVAAVLTSCEKQVNRQQVIDNVYVEETALDSGIGYKLVYNSGDDKYYSVSEQVYSKVEYNADAKLILAYNGGAFEIYNSEGSRRGSSDVIYKKIEVKDGKAYLTSVDDKTSLYLSDKGTIFGPYLKINLVDDKIFACNVAGWGLLDTDYNYLQDMVYEKLYILNQKDKKKYDVLRCRAGKWTMVTSDDAEYDPRAVKIVVTTLEKKVKPTEPVGVLSAKF